MAQTLEPQPLEESLISPLGVPTGRPRRRFGRSWSVILRDPLALAALLIIAFFLIAFIIFPLVKVLLNSLFDEQGSLDLSEYERVTTKPLQQKIIWDTLIMGGVVSVFSTALGFLFAYTMTRCKIPGRRLLHFTALLPVISPPFAVAMAVVLLFGRSGLITNKILGLSVNIYGWPGLILVQTITFYPVAYLLLIGLLQSLNPALEEASLNLGASKWRVFRTVTLPLLIPGLGASLLLIFVETLADLANPLLIGGDINVLATQTYLAIVGTADFRGAAVYSVVLLVPSLTAFLLQRYWVNRRSYISVTGKPQGGRIVINEPLARWTLVGTCFLVGALVILIYGTIIASAFTKLFGIDYTPTLDNFKYLFDSPNYRDGMVNTVWLAILATPVVAILSTITAWLVVRRGFAGRSVLDFVSMLGAAVPGTIIGIGYILAFNNAPLALTGTSLIIILVFVIRGLPSGLRSTVAALQQIDPTIEEASTSLGASTAYTFRRITIPLVRPAVLAGVIYSFTRSMTSLSAIIFLVGPNTRLVTAQTYNLLENGRFGAATAYVTLLILVVLAAMALLTWLVRGPVRPVDTI
jgi:iron(III) transport system permease protein